MRRMYDVGFGKFLIMILITWLTLLPGLGNLIFLWSDQYYRNGAITALAVSVTCYIVIAVFAAVEFVSMADLGYIIVFFIVLGIRIWMTLDAVRAYNESRSFGPRSEYDLR